MDILKKIYYSPIHPGSLGSPKTLLQYAKREGYKHGLKSVKTFLASQNAYTLHKRRVKKFGRRMTISSRINKQMQLDLIDVHKLSKYNKGVKFLLTCIDVFSRRAYVRGIKSKHGKDVLGALKLFLPEINSRFKSRQWRKAQTDQGLEFYNSAVKSFFKQNDIIHFSTNSELKASICERFNRTIMERISRYLTAKNTSKYIDVLQALVQGYNNRYHRNLGMAPNKV